MLFLASRLALFCLLAWVLSCLPQASARAQTAEPIGAVIFAQCPPQPSLQPVIDIISDLMLVVGGIVIFAGAIRIYRGEIFEGTVALLAGGIIAFCFAIIRWFVSKA